MTTPDGAGIRPCRGLTHDETYTTDAGSELALLPRTGVWQGAGWSWDFLSIVSGRGAQRRPRPLDDGRLYYEVQP